MIQAQDAIDILQNLTAHNIPVWLVGGWGIDALLQKETRPHHDLDILVRVDDVVPLQDLLDRSGYGLKELWSENAWTHDSRGAQVPTAFVLQDAEGREVDVHAMRFDGQGQGLPAWEADGLTLTQQDLAGEGTIAGFAVRCFTPEMQVRAHTGYDLPPEHERDVELLRTELGVDWGHESNSPAPS